VGGLSDKDDGYHSADELYIYKGAAAVMNISRHALILQSLTSALLAMSRKLYHYDSLIN